MDVNGVRMRDALETDLAQIVAIHDEAIPGRQATADTEPVSVVSRLPWFAEHSPARRPLWVAERGGLVVGWLSFQSGGRQRPLSPEAEQAKTNTRLATAPMTMDPAKSAVGRWSPRLAENTIHMARGAVTGIVAMMAARWRERS